MKHLFLGTLLIVCVLACVTGQITAPKPYGVTPSQDQIAWQKMEYYMFIHFGINTFTDKEWGDGKENIKLFNPTSLDCKQWASTAKAAGMKAIILTVKHHDGFCLWPSQYSTHTVGATPWKNGKGDLLKELSEACKEYGLKLGVYLSPWDRNHTSYGTDSYNRVFANTLTEVLGNYGTIFEQWFDGANGEGHSGKKQVYDWSLFHSTVFKLQPNAIIFSDIGPGCRWMGNEKGIAGETNWARLNTAGFGPGLDAPHSDTLNIGNINGSSWVPAETDVSIRPGWFYSPSTNDKVKSLNQLIDIYYSSIGRNSNLLLNVPPDRRGLIHQNDSIRLMEFKKAIDQMFSNDLTKHGKVYASNTRGNLKKYAASNIIDDKYDTYWTTEDNITTASFYIDLDKETSVNRIMCQEYIPLGQRIANFNVAYYRNGEWKEVAKATTIGYKRILKFPTVTTKKIRVNILNSLACPIINKLALYYVPDNTELGSQTKVEVNKKDRSKWDVLSPSNDDANKIIDNDYSSFDTIEKEQPLIIYLGKKSIIKGFTYTPVDKVLAENVYKYNFYISEFGQSWTLVKSNATFDNIANNPIMQQVFFDNPIKAKFIKMEVLESATQSKYYLVGDINIIK